MKQLLPATKKI
uniref:Uncharacterized protein n=1 Tax=Arundo donax TaxID=35708 RepID=A0A0A9H1H5_ARUDO